LLIGGHWAGMDQIQTLVGEPSDLLGDFGWMRNTRLRESSRVNQGGQKSRFLLVSVHAALLLRSLEKEQIRALAVCVLDLNLDRLAGFSLLAGLFGIEDLIWVLPAVRVLRRIVHKDNSTVAEVLPEHPQLLSEQHHVVDQRTIRIRIWIDL